MAEYLTNTNDLTKVASAIRAKAGTTEPLVWPDGFKAAIEAISGGGGTGLAYDMGEFVFDADWVASSVNSNAYPITHNLGDIPDFIMVWSDNWAGNTEVIDANYQTVVGFMWMRELTGMTVRASSNVNMVNPLLSFMTIPKGEYRLQYAAPTSTSYYINLEYLTADSFCPPTMGTQIYWRGGVTYKYFVSKAWWNIGGVASAE